MTQPLMPFGLVADAWKVTGEPTVEPAAGDSTVTIVEVEVLPDPLVPVPLVVPLLVPTETLKVEELPKPLTLSQARIITECVPEASGTEAVKAFELLST